MSENLRNKLKEIHLKQTHLKEVINNTLNDFEEVLFYQVNQVVKLLKEHIEDILLKDEQLINTNKEIDQINILEEHIEQIRQCIIEFTKITNHSLIIKTNSSSSNHNNNHHNNHNNQFPMISMNLENDNDSDNDNDNDGNNQSHVNSILNHTSEEKINE